MIVVLALITLMAAALGLLGDRLKEVVAARESGQERSSGFPFHRSDHDD
jgi:hypothetical protein